MRKNLKFTLTLKQPDTKVIRKIIKAIDKLTISPMESFTKSTEYQIVQINLTLFNMFPVHFYKHTKNKLIFRKYKYTLFY